MAITLEECREITRQSSKNAGTDNYSDTLVDRAIRTIFDEFIWETRCLVDEITLTTTAEQNQLTVTTTDFDRNRVIKIEIDADQLVPVNKTWINWNEERESEGDDKPRFYAWEDETKLYLYPRPDAVYTVTVWWVPVLTSFTYGTGTETNLNIQPWIARKLCQTGVPAMLMQSDPEHRTLVTQANKKYEKLLNDYRGSFTGLKMIQTRGQRGGLYFTDLPGRQRWY